jgi:hypothetical protein
VDGVVADESTDAAQAAITDALWRAVLDDFDDDAVHAKFIQHCGTRGQLAEAAKRYRHHRDGLDDDDEAPHEAAEKRLNAVALLAVAQFDTDLGDEPRRHPALAWITLFIVLMFIAAVGGFLWALLL